MTTSVPSAFARPRLLSVVVVLAAAPAAHAEGNPPAVSRPELLARVRAGEPRIEAARARIDLARAEVRRASRLANPVASYDREAVTIAGEDQIDQFIQLRWSLDVSGRRGRSIAAAEHGEVAARREAAADSLEALYAGLAAFHEAAYQRLRVTILEEGRGEIARAVETLRTRQKAGDAAGYDTDRLELELGAHDDLIAEARIDLANARTELARVALSLIHI